MYKKIIIGALVSMPYHGIYVAMNFSNDLKYKSVEDYLTHVRLENIRNNILSSEAFQQASSSSAYSNYNNDLSNTMSRMHSDYLNRLANQNQAYRNTLLQSGFTFLSSKEGLKRKAFANSLRDMQLAGDMAAMRALHSQITQEKNSYWGIRLIKHRNREWRLKLIEKVSSDPMTLWLHTIKTGDFQAATTVLHERFSSADHLAGFPSGRQHGVKVTTTVPEGQTSKAFGQSPLPAESEAALRLMRARPDYQAFMKARQEQQDQQHVAPVAATTAPSVETTQGTTTASTAHPAEHSVEHATEHQAKHTTAERLTSVAESLVPLDDTLKAVQSASVASSALRQKLVAAKAELLSTLAASSSSVDISLEKQVQFIDMMLDGTLAGTLSELQYADFEIAKSIYEQLVEQWPWRPYEQTFLVRDISDAQAAFIQTIGTDIMAVIEGHIIARPENIIRAGIGNQVDGYLNECMLWQMQGDVTSLKAEHARLKTELSTGRPELLSAAQFIIIERILRDPLTDRLCTIVHGDLAMATKAFHSLEMDLLKYVELGCDFSTMAQARSAMENEKGFDVQRAAHSCYQARPDCPEEFKKQIYTDNGQLMQILFNIRHADFDMATKEFAALNEQLADNLQRAGIEDAAAKDFILEHVGFNVREVASALYHARPEYQAEQMEPVLDGYRPLPVEVIPKEIRSVRAGMLEALNQSTSQAQLADNCQALMQDIFGLAHKHNYLVHPEAYDQVHISIGVIRETPHEHEIVFHVAIVDRVLGDIQTEIQGQQMPDQPSLLERSPELLVHGLKKFIHGLNPVTQIKNSVEFWVSTAHFVADITVGGFYLTPEQYQARIDGFWQSVEAFSPENLAQLTAEQWVEMGAQMAADFVYAKGVASTLSYLKEIDAVSKVKRKVSVIADTFNKGFDKVLGKEPIVVTPEGIIWKASSECEELVLLQKSANKMGGGTREVIKDSAKLLEKEVELIAKPLDYGHSVVQYEKLKKLLQIEEITSVIDVTEHGLKRILERGFEATELLNLVKAPDFLKVQLDGAKVFIKQVGQNKYNLMIFNEETKKVITALRKTTLGDLQKLGSNHGWSI